MFKNLMGLGKIGKFIKLVSMLFIEHGLMFHQSVPRLFCMPLNTENREWKKANLDESL
jgi:hypothetical protein